MAPPPLCMSFQTLVLSDVQAVSGTLHFHIFSLFCSYHWRALTAGMCVARVLQSTLSYQKAFSHAFSLLLESLQMPPTLLKCLSYTVFPKASKTQFVGIFDFRRDWWIRRTLSWIFHFWVFMDKAVLNT
jgi:hypothetical protein